MFPGIDEAEFLQLEVLADSIRQLQPARGNCAEKILVVIQPRTMFTGHDFLGIHIGAENAVPQCGRVAVVTLEIARVV